MWGVLGLFKISDIFMIFHRYLQLYLRMMAKREKLLAIYDAIPTSVWAEMAIQILINPFKFQNRLWGI